MAGSGTGFASQRYSAGSVLVTNGSGCGTVRPKNIRIPITGINVIKSIFRRRSSSEGGPPRSPHPPRPSAWSRSRSVLCLSSLLFSITEFLTYIERLGGSLCCSLVSRWEPPSSVLLHQYLIFLCTGASLYAPYSLPLISNKFWMRGGRVGSQWGRSGGAELEGENKKVGGGE
jgi:hypothetical protein